jgi:hypothetical protein
VTVYLDGHDAGLQPAHGLRRPASHLVEHLGDAVQHARLKRRIPLRVVALLPRPLVGHRRAHRVLDQRGRHTQRAGGGGGRGRRLLLPLQRLRVRRHVSSPTEAQDAEKALILKNSWQENLIQKTQDVRTASASSRRDSNRRSASASCVPRRLSAIRRLSALAE